MEGYSFLRFVIDFGHSPWPFAVVYPLKLYEKLADEIGEAVRRGGFAAGERIPSVRQSSQQHGVSIKTVLHAYALLEGRGLIETRPQSG